MSLVIYNTVVSRDVKPTTTFGYRVRIRTVKWKS